MSLSTTITALTLIILNMEPLPYIYIKWPTAKYIRDTCMHLPCVSHDVPLSGVLSRFVNADVWARDWQRCVVVCGPHDDCGQPDYRPVHSVPAGHTRIHDTSAFRQPHTATRTRQGNEAWYHIKGKLVPVLNALRTMP
jgi:hypothetical protein